MAAIANVLLTHTFNEWRLITNQLSSSLNQIEANGNLIRLQSNTSALSITPTGIGRGGLITFEANLSYSLNDNSSNFASANLANLTYNFGRRIFDQANLAYNEANTRASVANLVSIYNQANTARDTSNNAWDRANAAYIQANGAFNSSNTRATLANANIIFTQTNTAVSAACTSLTNAVSAFTQANTARDQANAAFNQANLAFNQANAAYNRANTALPRVTVRQTTLTGPVFANGYPGFLPSNNGTDLTVSTMNVTASRPLIVTAANGSSTTGQVDFIQVISSNVKWWGLTASSNCYLYINAANGSNGFTTLQPNYIYAGDPSTTAGQYTFIINEMKGYMGTGSAWEPSSIVFVGEANTNSANVARCVPYSFQGTYESEWRTPLVASGVANTYPARIGTITGLDMFLYFRCLTTQAGYSVGDIVWPESNYYVRIAKFINGTAGLEAGYTNYGGWYIPNKTSATETALTPANWEYKFLVKRKW